MGCVELPLPPPLPSLGAFTIEPPALPAVDLSIDYCCKVQLISFTPQIPLGPAVVAVPGAAAIIAGINSALAVIQAYLDALPLDCPLD